MVGFSSLPLSRYLINVPNFSNSTSSFYFILFISYLILYFWWIGLPDFISNLKIIKNHIPEKFRLGKKKSLHAFFYPQITLSDELVRSRNHDFFEGEGLHIGNLFNYTAIGGLRYDEEGTNRIISLFRDSKSEMLRKKIKLGEDKVKKNAEGALKRREDQFLNKKKPSPEQEFIYDDLFAVVGGMLEGYTSKYDRIHIDHSLKSPLKVMVDRKEERIDSFSVENKVSVFDEGKVYFSITMLAETTKKVTLLYVEYIRLLLQTNSKLSYLLDDDIMREENILQEFEDFFKLVFFRRLLRNYGSIPSGWMCVRIESYDMRAIFSAVDRPMIPVVPDNADMYTDMNSDKKAASFLMSYWSFIRSKEYGELIEDIDWCFNTTVEISELTRESTEENS